MFSPKEAAEDSRALNIVILLFAAVAVSISIGLHFDSALKYWLLTGYGETANGTIVKVTEAPSEPDAALELARQSPRNYLKNRQAWVSGDSLLIEFLPQDAPVQYVLFKRPPGSSIGHAGKAVQIAYLPVNPKIAHPLAHLPDFAIDSKIMIGSLIAAVILLWLFVEAFAEWMRFRRNMRHY